MIKVPAYDVSYAPTGRMHAFHMLLPISPTYNWSVYNIDIKSAFICRVLKEEITMKPPKVLRDQVVPGKT